MIVEGQGSDRFGQRQGHRGEGGAGKVGRERA